MSRHWYIILLKIFYVFYIYVNNRRQRLIIHYYYSHILRNFNILYNVYILFVNNMIILILKLNKILYILLYISKTHVLTYFRVYGFVFNWQNISPGDYDLPTLNMSICISCTIYLLVTTC